MADGAPNGHSIISFDGHKYSLEFKAAGRPANFQMSIQAPEVVATDKACEVDIFVNVFNGSERSKVEMRFGKRDSWTAMQRNVMVDPAYQAVYDAEKSIKEKPWRDLPEPKKSTHLWQAKLPSDPKPGTHMLLVRTTDMHGRKFWGRRVIRVSPPAATE